MIRWKQAKVHKERAERKDQYDLLELEYSTTAKFLEIMPSIFANIPNQPIEFLLSLAPKVEAEYTDILKKESTERIRKWPSHWDTPSWGDVLKHHIPWHEEISRFAKELAENAKSNPNLDQKRFVLDLVHESLEKFKLRQEVIQKELKLLSAQRDKNITMDHLQTGFSNTVYYLNLSE
jgi:cell division cycle protein 37